MWTCLLYISILYTYTLIYTYIYIGGSIDSTGQVVASAEMGGEDVLKTAVIIKMAQNILIGPLCLFFTGYFHGSFQPSILINRFPLFVVGFLITSTITTIVLNNDAR